MFCCPGCFPRRRAVLSAAAVAALPSAPAHALGERWIDVHCHVFNGWDLPMVEFIDQTRDSWGASLAADLGVLAFLTGGLKNEDFTAAKEAAQLDGRFRSLARAATAPRPVSTEEALLQIEGSASPPPDQPDLRGSRTMGLARSAQRPAWLPSPAQGQRLVIRAVDDLQQGRRTPGAPVTAGERKALADVLDGAPSAFSFFGDTARMLRWGNRFSMSRNDIVAELVAQYPTGKDVFLTPAMIDYSRWLGIGPGSAREPSRMVDQVSVTAALGQKWSKGADGRRQAGVSGFAAFDPWRATESPQVLDELRSWLTTGQAIGVKLYPPMGFLPIGNAGLKPGDFPAGAKPGQALDDTLRRLYRMCVELEVPIMAHCGDSNFPREGYGQRSGPEGWFRVLAEFRRLRLNLAHFGGVWAFGKADPASPKDVAARETAQRWARSIAQTMSLGNGETYPNLYADVGYASSLLGEQDEGPDGAAAFMARLAREFPILRRKLMYGSDWQMVGLEENGNDYPRFVERHMASVFPGEQDREGFRWRNAARFLGLGSQDQTRKRLLRGRFDRAYLDRFNPDLH